jgi:hypothetical protein
MASLLLAAAMLGESSSSKSWALGSMADMVGVDCTLLVFVLGFVGCTLVVLLCWVTDGLILMFPPKRWIDISRQNQIWYNKKRSLKNLDS